MRVWIKKTLAEGTRPGAQASSGLSSAERDELQRLRKEVRDLKQANEILKLASAFRAGTRPAKDGVRAADLLNRDFTATAPNLVWVVDFTYVSTWTGWAYVAFVFDVYSRAIVGWTAANSKTTALVSKALNMAVWRRGHHGLRSALIIKRLWVAELGTGAMVVVVGRWRCLPDQRAVEQFPPTGPDPAIVFIRGMRTLVRMAWMPVSAGTSSSKVGPAGTVGVRCGTPTCCVR